MKSTRKYRFICVLYLWFLSALWFSCCLASEETSERLYVQGLVPFSEGDYLTALERFQKAADESQPYGLAVYYLGLTYGKLGEYEKAIFHFNNALKLLAMPVNKMGLLHVYWDMAAAYYRLERYHAGLEVLKKAEEIEPDNGLTYYYQGLGYSGLKQYDAAIQSLSKAAELDTGLVVQQADYQRSHAHLAKGDIDSAMEALQGIVATAPDTELAVIASNRIKQLAAQIQRKKPEKPWEIRFGVGGGYDSNVILQPNGGPTGVGQISDEQDSGAIFTLGGTVDLWRRPSGYLTGNYDFYQSIHGTLKDYDVQAHHVQLTGGWSPDPALTLGLQGGVNYYLLGNEEYLLEFSGMPFIGFFIHRDFYTQILYQYTYQDYLDPIFDKIRDGTRQEVSIRQYYLMNQFDSYISLGYRYDMEDPNSDAGDDFQYYGHSVELSMLIPTPWETTLELGYNFHKRNYAFPNSRSNFTTARDDSEHDFLVSLSKPLPFLERFDTYMEASISYRGTINDSNINVYEYNRNIVTVNIEFVY